MKNQRKTNWLKVSLLTIVICGIVGSILAVALFFGNASPAYASATLVFTFDGAADGLAPNGTAFDMRDITSDEVLFQGLQNASLSDRLTPEQVRPNLVVNGVYPDNMAKQIMHYESLLNFTASREMTIGDYHPTTFSILLYNSFDKSISKAELSALLQGIMEAYSDFFSKVYAFGLDENDVLFTLDNHDYPQQLQIIEKKLTILSDYAQEMYEKEPSFRLNGAGFNDISVRLNSLIESNINRLNAELTINVLTREPARLLNQYQFEISSLNNQLDKQNQELQKLDKLIASYEKNEIIYLKTNDALTKIDGNSSETYDALMGRRKSVADGITEINYKIATYQLLLADLMGENKGTDPAAVSTSESAAAAQNDDPSQTDESTEPMTEEQIAAATAEIEKKTNARRALLEENIHHLVSESDAVTADFKAILEAYNRQKINDLTVTVVRYGYNAPHLLSGAFIKKAILTAGPLVTLGFMTCVTLLIISRKKEER